jgi:NAD-dependent deacetylase
MLAIAPTDRIFVVTGAGVSAESGIPTFRGVNGLWRNYRIEEVASPEAWHRDPQLVWEFYSMRRRVASSAKPNPAHFALAKLENSLQDRLFVCTQNVDNLKEQAGSKKVIHMHGELFKSRCETCSRRPFDDTNLYEPPAEIPRCQCGGRIRPHICWFGEVPFEVDLAFFWGCHFAIIYRFQHCDGYQVARPVECRLVPSHPECIPELVTLWIAAFTSLNE